MTRITRCVLLVSIFLSFSKLSASILSDTLTAKSLDEVLISATLSPLIKEKSKLIFYPEKLSATPATLAELLRFIPSMESDMDGNLSFRGSTKLTILVNGRPSGAMGDYRSEVLVQYPTEAIERIEVDTSPSANAISEGNAGVINIVLKGSGGKNGGSASLGIANDTRYRAQANYGTELGAWRISGLVAYKKEYRERSFKNRIVTDPQKDVPTSTQQQNNTANARPQSITGNIGIAYAPNKKNEWGIDFSFLALQFARIGRIHNLETPIDATKTKELNIVRDNNQKNSDIGISTYYNRTLSEKDNQLKFTLLYQSSRYDEGNLYTRTVVRPKPNVIEDKLAIDRTTQEWLPAITYTQPIGKSGWLESGYWMRYESSIHDNKKVIKNGDGWQEAPLASFTSDITRNIHALFVQYRLSLASYWNLQMGIREEYTRRNVSLASSDKIPAKTDWQLLPSVQVAYQSGAKHHWSLAYNRRLNRPTLLELTPFTDQADPTNWLKGNPNLRPEVVDNISLNYRFTHPVITLSPALFYRYQKNSVEMRSEADANNQIITIFDNLYSTQAGGIEATAMLTPTKWFNFQLNASLYFNQIDAGNWGGDRKKSDWVDQFQGVITFLLTPTTRLQIDGGYFSDRLTAQGTISSRYYVNTAIRQQILGGKASVALSVNDWFNSVREITVIDTPSLYKRVEKQKDNQTIWLSANFRF